MKKPAPQPSEAQDSPKLEQTVRGREPRSTVTIRLPTVLLHQIDALAKRRGSDRSPVLVDLLERGVAVASLMTLTDESLAQLNAVAFPLAHIQASIDDLAAKIDAL